MKQILAPLFDDLHAMGRGACELHLYTSAPGSSPCGAGIVG